MTVLSQYSTTALLSSSSIHAHDRETGGVADPSLDNAADQKAGITANTKVAIVVVLGTYSLLNFLTL